MKKLLVIVYTLHHFTVYKVCPWASQWFPEIVIAISALPIRKLSVGVYTWSRMQPCGAPGGARSSFLHLVLGFFLYTMLLTQWKMKTQPTCCLLMQTSQSVFVWTTRRYHFGPGCPLIFFQCIMASWTIAFRRFSLPKKLVPCPFFRCESQWEILSSSTLPLDFGPNW